jgi:hypothetical protein
LHAIARCFCCLCHNRYALALNLTSGCTSPLAQGEVHESCAVVGSAGTLLLARSGSAIDDHALVLRAETASVAGFEAHVGSRTDVRVTSSGSWGFIDAPGETSLMRTQSPAALEGLRWAAGRRPAPRLVASHPDFDAYVARSFDFAAGSALYATLLALHTCHKVTVYGVLVPGTLPGAECSMQLRSVVFEVP